MYRSNCSFNTPPHGVLSSRNAIAMLWAYSLLQHSYCNCYPASCSSGFNQCRKMQTSWKLVSSIKLHLPLTLITYRRLETHRVLGFWISLAGSDILACLLISQVRFNTMLSASFPNRMPEVKHSQSSEPLDCSYTSRDTCRHVFSCSVASLVFFPP